MRAIKIRKGMRLDQANVDQLLISTQRVIVQPMHTSRHSVAPSNLPELDPSSLAHKEKMEAHLASAVQNTPQRYLPFDQWMHLALYAPGLGYYAAGNAKLGSRLGQGDFTTAPEMTPLFGQTLARQAAQVLQGSGSANVLEFGAGSGALAEAMIPALRAQGIEPRYHILEVSPDLRARQQQRLASFGAAVVWLDALPERFSGCVLANEVLDAMPTSLFCWNDDETVDEIGVRLIDHDSAVAPNAAGSPSTPFVWARRPAEAPLQDAVIERMPPMPGYQSEINLQGEAWVRGMGSWLEKGAALLIDYGFPRAEYYHPQRASGTLMCHFRHYAHSEPLIYPGLQDITAHVDFTAMADAALDGGLDVLGYASQARFLMNAGLPDLLVSLDPRDGKQHHATDPLYPPRATGTPSFDGRSPMPATTYAMAFSAVQKLISEAEMGELFKVLAVGRGIHEPLAGFTRGDRRHRL